MAARIGDNELSPPAQPDWLLARLQLAIHYRRLDDAQLLAGQMLLGPDTASKAQGHFYMGQVLHASGDFSATAEQYQAALDLSRQIGNSAGAANSVHQLGILAQEQLRHAEAESLFTQALQTEEALGMKSAEASTMHQLGTVAQFQGDLNEAREWYRLSLELEEALGNRSGQAAILYQLGTLAEEMHDIDDAEGCYRRSLQVADQTGEDALKARASGRLGLMLLSRGCDSEAGLLLEQAALIFQRSEPAKFRSLVAHLKRP